MGNHNIRKIFIWLPNMAFHVLFVCLFGATYIKILHKVCVLCLYMWKSSLVNIAAKMSVDIFCCCCRPKGKLKGFKISLTFSEICV